MIAAARVERFLAKMLVGLLVSINDAAARLIACATDQAFFHPEFRLSVTKLLDERLATIDRALMQYLSQQLDMNDLAADRSRLLRMRATQRGPHHHPPFRDDPCYDPARGSVPT